MEKAIYQRILLKLSGESLKGRPATGIDPAAVAEVASRIRDLAQLGVQVGVVIGAGNLFRGLAASRRGMDRVTADNMGMLATVMNSLALQDGLEAQGVTARVMTAIEMREIAEPFICRRAIAHLEKGRVVIFAAGTGHPFFTTDTTAALRACQMKAGAVIKATQVDGVYSADPRTHPDAIRYPRLSFEQALQENLGVMDATAFSMCRENNIPIIVCKFSEPGCLRRVVCGDVSIASVVGGK